MLNVTWRWCSEATYGRVGRCVLRIESLGASFHAPPVPPGIAPLEPPIRHRSTRRVSGTYGGPADALGIDFDFLLWAFVLQPCKLFCVCAPLRCARRRSCVCSCCTRLLRGGWRQLLEVTLGLCLGISCVHFVWTCSRVSCFWFFPYVVW
jgi:hypothetical protein